MAAKEQSYSTHRRYNFWHHFVVQPIFIANFVVEVTRMVEAPTGYNAWLVFFAFGLLLFSFTARSMSLRAQDRVIRLEEQLRLSRLLMGDDVAAIDRLRPGQLIALRFASDEEVPDLVRRCTSGELTSPEQIKKAISSWRPDYLRV